MPKTTLIADSGSTKTAWCLIKNGQQKRIKTQGISPYFLNVQEIKAVLSQELFPHLNCKAEDVQQLYFYGTGLGVPEKAQLMHELFQEIFNRSEIVVYHDLTGAAHALCLHEAGLACILGTGSGFCYYDGERIVKSRTGLGFILGDEGSGAYLGKMLIQRYLNKTLDQELMVAFEEKYHLSKGEILKKVYQESYPNRFLASFSLFLGENRANSEVMAIIEQGIRDFLQIHVKSYQESQALPVHFVGGIAGAFEGVIRRLCATEGIKVGQILSKALDGLIEYHQN